MNTILSTDCIEAFYSEFCSGLLNLGEEDSIKIKGTDQLIDDVHLLPRNTNNVGIKAHIDVTNVRPIPVLVYTLLSGCVVFKMHLEGEEAFIETIFSKRFEKNKDLTDFNMIHKADSFKEKKDEILKLSQIEVETFNTIKNAVRNQHRNLDII